MTRFLLAAIVAFIVVGACSGSPPPATQAPIAQAPSLAPATSVASAAASVPATAPAPTATAPTTPPMVSPPASDGVATDEPQETFHGALELEARVPDQVGDITIEKMSFSGQEWFDLTTGGHPATTQALNAFLAGLGTSIDDVSAAGGSGFSESSDAYVYVTAFKVAGADSAALLNGAIQFAVDIIPFGNDGMSGTATPVTLGGKNATLVTAVLGGGTVIDESYYYGYGDVVFRVSGDSEETVAAAFALLP